MSADRLEKLLQFLEKEPDDEFLQYALATEYLRLNDTANALFYYEKLIREHPDYVGTYYHLGKLYESLDRRSDAIQTYESGIETAQRKKDNHALAELRTVYAELSGMEDDTD